LAVLLVFLIGCGGSAYVADRGRDAADIVSVSLGIGLGAKARVGPIHAGLLAQKDCVGLRGGQIGATGNNGDFESPLPLPVGYPPPFSSIEFYRSRGKLKADVRSKSYAAHGQLPFVTHALMTETNPVTIHPYFADIVGVVAAGLSVRVGFNPGELLDFLLGWLTVDIFGDDVGSLGATTADSSSAGVESG
jgi:hypothetical protein